MNCMPNSDGSLRISPPSRAPRYGGAASPHRGRRWFRYCRCMQTLCIESAAQRGAVPTILCSRSAHLAGLAWPLALEGAPASHVLAGRLSIGWLLDRPARHLRHDCLWRQSIARSRLDVVHDSAHHGSHIRRPIPTFQRPRFLSISSPDFARYHRHPSLIRTMSLRRVTQPSSCHTPQSAWQ